MKIIEQSKDICNSNFDAKACFLDIETTGLMPNESAIFCIGISYIKDNLFCSTQLFSEVRTDEKEMLNTFLEIISPFDKIYTYGGTRFDIPFINTRLILYSLPTIEIKKSFDLKKVDLFKTINNNKRTRSSLELRLGISRNVETSGKELVKLYSLYLEEPKDIYLNILLTHNLEELLSLYNIYLVYIIFLNLTTNNVVGLEFEDDLLKLLIHTPWQFKNDFEFETDLLKVTCYKKDIFINLRVIETTLKSYLSPYKDYVFVPSQNQLMHKSVARFIPKDLTQKVSAKECFIDVSSKFIRVDTKIKKGFSKIYYDTHNTPYIMYDEDWNAKDIWELIRHKIRPKYL